MSTRDLLRKYSKRGARFSLDPAAIVLLSNDDELDAGDVAQIMAHRDGIRATLGAELRERVSPEDRIMVEAVAIVRALEVSHP